MKYAAIEKKWNKLWRKAGVFEPDFKRAKKPFYNLMMFPYPSAEGLHVGNMYAFTGSDIYGRFKRMQGNDVFEPIGLDGFGIHSENYAMKVGQHPARQAKISEKNFYRQLEMIGNGFSWNEKLETYDPTYYKWTQWIFVQMFKHGLAYRKKKAVNWCPSCMTVLADEQVIGGECERCLTKVINKDLEQWFFRITKYAEKLLNDLEKIDWSGKVKIAQRNWIGKSEGALIRFPLVFSLLTSDVNKGARMGNVAVEIFTTRPDTLFGATYIVLSPDHEIIEKVKAQISNLKEVENYILDAKKKTAEEREEAMEKTGAELKGIYAINPANQEKIPVWISDYVLAGYGTGAIMAVPASDARDFEFAKKFNLPVRKVVLPKPLFSIVRNAEDLAAGAKQTLRVAGECYEGSGELINSGEFSSMDSEKAKWEITKFVGGKRKTQYRLRDWLISRQRYWGPPIPMIYCEKCADAGKGERKEMPGWYAVLAKDLPVKLPYIKDFRPRGSGVSPLARYPKFFKAKCPKCSSIARRETDVSDTFLDSAWYYLRYIDPKNNKEIFSDKLARKWLPVDMYIGGAEHSVLHLLYVRFLAKVFNDMKLTHFDEPFLKFRAHGLIVKDGAKMSKSKGNVVNPDQFIKKFGADALRMYLMFIGPFEEGGDFRDQGILGITRFLARVEKISLKISKSLKAGLSESSEIFLHQSIKKITEDTENLRYNTAISQLMILLNHLEELPEIPRKTYETFLKLLAPYAPYISEELYQMFSRKKTFGKKDSLHLSVWPKYNLKKVIEESFYLVVQVNGRVRSTIKAKRGISQLEAEALAKKDNNVLKYMSTENLKKVIFVPDKLINFVL
ncbi:leucine--tRNA ligase [Candidatus Giovannonibacteria bacterium]|nr:leucine--tRNA ligase [Candidatus Giovannonibacteria bacterium]